MSTPEPDLHPNLVELAPLLGTWSGQGRGVYPTITAFDYHETVVFGHVGKPFFTYRQTTRAVVDDRPLHAEVGYLRVPRPGTVEWIVAHPTGITEIEAGDYAVADAVITMALQATAIGLSPSAKEVRELNRSLRIDGDVLSYTVGMGAVGQPEQNHLRAVLHRQR
ncbi:peroxynitrite isomerase [Mycolicibacillus koreensis]|uniref:peroxynitrite isomerase n=1 Tax=Mycolicibacillus koreensis TaxID=1069220 RepID=UPI000848A282|nr:FABP family protein [Mycolicibacillus koreensis]ODR07552.1 fatty acid-binding-like protein [Mycolicibacillus koreensis]BBY54280.1 UPF0678 fatty acid-binding protein-like protein [Mycolicibacillus koreensis]